MSFLFHFSALSVLPFWGAMIFFPNTKMTARLVATPWSVLPAVLCYVIFALPHMPELLAVFGSPSPDALATIMGKPWAASMFWAYAGAFDLFVGRWMYLDSRERGIRHLFVAPALMVAILFGPIGLLMYAAVRLAVGFRGNEVSR